MSQSFADIEAQLLTLVREFLTELQSERAYRIHHLNTSLDRDLGIGSLERAELLHRCEKAFSVTLPDDLLAEARTLQDIASAIFKANPTHIMVNPAIRLTTISRSKVDPSKSKTLIDVLQLYANKEPDRPHVYLQDEYGVEKTIRYKQLYDSAVIIAKGLVAHGLRPCESVAIMLPTCEDFFYCFYGVLLAGGLPVPIYPPFRPDKLEEYVRREANILKNAEVRILITFAKVERLGHLLSRFIPSLKSVLTASDVMQKQDDLPSILIPDSQPALIQYTSGSTGDPKGVLLNHQNLLANIRAFGQGIQLQNDDAAVSWLPLYHDMGLIGAWLGSLYHGVPATIMSPLTFLTRPERWLWAIHHHQATVSAGPNFAYELCLKKIDDRAIEGLDLSSWRLAFNGAEAIYPDTLRGFAKRFAKYGFREEALFPVYGLAESCVALTFPTPGEKYRIDQIKRDVFEEHQLAVETHEQDENALEFVSCGKALVGHEIRVVDEQNNILAERKQGLLQFKGPSAMQGYYHNPKATAEVHHDGWWDTGDYAYLADGNVYITGRKKDIVIKAGRNLYPQQAEQITSQVAGIRKGCVIAFGVSDPVTATEKFVIVAETREKRLAQRKQMIEEITANVYDGLGVPPDHVVLVQPKTVPKTSSGKLQRSACKQAFINRTLVTYKLPLWMQVLRLSIESVGKMLTGLVKTLFKLVMNIILGVILLVNTLLGWLVVLVLPRDQANHYCRYSIRFLFYLTTCRIKVEGKRNLMPNKAVIYVANHASYLDSPLLQSFLPNNVVGVGKIELMRVPIVRTYLKKLGAVTVTRSDIQQSHQDMEAIGDAIKAGHSVLIFPEGTFVYASGLLPFKKGAFKLAADLNIPICPIAIKGMRKVLRDSQVLFTPGPIHVTIGKPIVPKGNTWSDIAELSAKARDFIAKHCGEY